MAVTVVAAIIESDYLTFPPFVYAFHNLSLFQIESTMRASNDRDGGILRSRTGPDTKGLRHDARMATARPCAIGGTARRNLAKHNGDVRQNKAGRR